MCVIVILFALAGCQGPAEPAVKGDFFYFSMKLVPAGSFLMGADAASQTAGTMNTWGDTIHQVTLSAFNMDVTEVTQAAYKLLMGVNPSQITGDSLRPVEYLTWYDAVLFCNARSKRDSLDTVYSYDSITGTPGNGCTALGGITIDYTKKGYRLPTEAEYEYVCRCGSMTNYWWGDDTNGMGVRTWSGYNSGGATHTVSTKLANAYGLYDITGNVWEWCSDWNGSYSAAAATDPTGPATGTERNMRGGCYADYTVDFYSKFRNCVTPSGRLSWIGLRCVLHQ
jgi:formylglycine-generating enzyme